MSSHTEIIEKAREQWGERLAILGHHYMSDEVIRHTDLRGDSLELARRVRGLKAERIVFCGVYFMAESAAILRRDDQQVHIPQDDASCTMADMALAPTVETVLQRLEQSGRKVVPLTYVNSSAAVKAVVGAHGGTVCTSANAETMLRWALDRGDSVLFLPDRNLAHNTADRLGIEHDHRHVLNIRGAGSQANMQSAARARLIIWPGMCSIHHRMKLSTIEEIRQDDPDALVAVHPECKPELVQASDGAGSTSYLIRFVEQAPEGATIYVGTETNLVLRLAKQWRGRKTVIPLEESYCKNMGKIRESNLAALLQNLDGAAPAEVDEEVAAPARLALERMLEACS